MNDRKLCHRDEQIRVPNGTENADKIGIRCIGANFLLTRNDSFAASLFFARGKQNRLANFKIWEQCIDRGRSMGLALPQ